MSPTDEQLDAWTAALEATVLPDAALPYEVPIGEDGWQVDPHEWEEVPVKTEPEEKPQEEVPDEAAEESAEEPQEEVPQEEAPIKAEPAEEEPAEEEPEEEEPEEEALPEADVPIKTELVEEVLAEPEWDASKVPPDFALYLLRAFTCNFDGYS